MKSFANEYEIEMYNIIKSTSKNENITDISKLKEALEKRNIIMKIENNTEGKVRTLSFADKRGKFEINGDLGKERFQWEPIKKNVEQNLKNMKEKEQLEKDKPTYNRFDELKKHREETAKQEQTQKQNKSFGI
jgi:hypothetical protein